MRAASTEELSPGVGGEAVSHCSSPYLVAAAPVWELVRRRQQAWGYSDDEMAGHLGLGSTVDARGLMGRPMAERILRRLCAPAPATSSTAEATKRAAASEIQLDLSLARMDAIRRLGAAGASLDDIAGELGISVRSVQRLAAELGLDYRARAAS